MRLIYERLDGNRVYELLFTAQDEYLGVETAVYQCVTTGEIFTLPLVKFEERHRVRELAVNKVI